MIVSDVGMVIASSARSKAYLQGLVKNKLYPAYVLILEDGSNDCLPGQLSNDVCINNSKKSNELIDQVNPFFDLNESLIETIEKNGIDYEICKNSDINSKEVVEILKDPNTNKTVLICYNPNLGLIGFRVKLTFELQGFPEDYTISLTKKAKLKILKPSDKLKAKYLIRAIFQFDDSESINIERNIPIFFSQMKI